MRGFRLLFRTELRRLMTPAMVGLAIALVALTAFMTVMGMRFGRASLMSHYTYQSLSGFILIFGVAGFAGGMVAVDLKDHWLRTLLMRPVTRTEYLLARVLSVFSLYVIVSLLSTVAPVPIIAAALGKNISLDAGTTAAIVLLFTGQAYVILMLFTLASCWLTGMGNLFVVGGWALLASLVGTYVDIKFWDSAFMTAAVTFLFPSGFLDAAEAVRVGVDPVGSALWGFAAAAAITALAVVSLNRKTIDTGSE